MSTSTSIINKRDGITRYLVPNGFSIVAGVCLAFHFVFGLGLTVAIAVLRTREIENFNCSIDLEISATRTKQVHQACFLRYDRAHNLPISLFGFVLLGTGLTVLVSIIYVVVVRRRVKEIILSSEAGKINTGQQERRTVSVFYCYFVHLVVRALFGIFITVSQYTYLYSNGFDTEFSCHPPSMDENESRTLNSTSVTCMNKTASVKWSLGICVSVINGIVASVTLAELIYLFRLRLPIRNYYSGVVWSSDTHFVTDYFLRKQHKTPQMREQQHLQQQEEEEQQQQQPQQTAVYLYT